MGIVQGLTEFLPISSSGHLIIVPFLFGWDDAFITSLAFSVMLHLGTLVALLVYFRRDWLRLVPAGFATIRDRSFAGDPDRRLAWLLVVATIPAAIVGVPVQRPHRDRFRQIGLVAVTLVVGGGHPVARRPGRRRDRGVEDVTFPIAIGIGAPRRWRSCPGISRSGISISAGRFAGLDREAAARFAFLMATPITAGAAMSSRRASCCRRGRRRRRRSAARRRAGRGARVRARWRSVHARATCDAVARHLRLVPVRARRARHRRLAGGPRARPMEVMKQLRQRAIRDLVDQRPIRTQQELAAALRERGFRTTQATISRDVAELGLIKVTPRGTPPTPCRRGSSRPRRPARTGCASSWPTCRSRSTRPACCSSCARCPARPTPSRPPSTGPAGPRSRARSPATTRCSWRCPTGARCSASSAACSSRLAEGRLRAVRATG